MFWGAIGIGYKSDLVLCSNVMDGNEYVSIIANSKIIETCDMKYERHKWFFMQDGAPCHNSIIASNFFILNARLFRGGPQTHQT